MEQKSSSATLSPGPSARQSVHFLIVGERDAGQRLDCFLARNLSGFSRSALSKLIKSGRVRVDRRTSKAGYRLRSGNSIEVTVPPAPPLSLVPRKIDFPIIHEDDSLLVISKPPGLVVHPACGHTEHTLVHGLLHHCSSLPGDDALRPGIVHRLDKDTSGIMLVAKNEAVLRKLSADFKNRKIHKVYHALLIRAPQVAGGGERGRIVEPISRHPVHRQKMAVRATGGRYAATRWRLLEAFPGGPVFAELSPETGRTHQIRVHMAFLKSPVAGDRLYGGVLPARLGLKAERQLLHASRLSFDHPESGRRMTLSAPLWPDMQIILERLRAMQNESP